MIFHNELKGRLALGEVCVTSGLAFYAPELVEILSRCGLDAISIDCEHGTMSEADVANLARACELSRLPAICRVPALAPEFVQRILDGGAMGIVMPHVSTPEAARRTVEAVKYPPEGRRGLGAFTRATGFGALKVSDYIADANRQTMVTVQIEDPEGVQSIDRILDVEGIDCVWIGYNDLALAMGMPGRAGDPEVQAAVDRVMTATRASGRAVQVVSELDAAEHWVSRGATLLSFGWTGLLTGRLREAAGIARGLASGQVPARK